VGSLILPAPLSPSTRPLRHHPCLRTSHLLMSCRKHTTERPFARRSIVYFWPSFTEIPHHTLRSTIELFSAVLSPRLSVFSALHVRHGLKENRTCVYRIPFASTPLRVAAKSVQQSRYFGERSLRPGIRWLVSNAETSSLLSPNRRFIHNICCTNLFSIPVSL
jgi:hypothetical protein